jgi:hypothetical protein
VNEFSAIVLFSCLPQTLRNVQLWKTFHDPAFSSYFSPLQSFRGKRPWNFAQLQRSSCGNGPI